MFEQVLEAITTERCMEGFSLERLEVLGDAFLKYAVSRRLFLVFDKLDEGQLTKKRSNSIKNSNLYKRAKGKGFPVLLNFLPLFNLLYVVFIDVNFKLKEWKSLVS